MISCNLAHHCAVSTAVCWLVVGREECKWNKRTVAVVVAAQSPPAVSTLLYSLQYSPSIEDATALDAKLLDTSVNYCEGGLFLLEGTCMNGPLLMTLRTMFAKCLSEKSAEITFLLVAST
jgi:hypothetical protein